LNFFLNRIFTFHITVGDADYKKDDFRVWSRHLIIRAKQTGLIETDL